LGPGKNQSYALLLGECASRLQAEKANRFHCRIERESRLYGGRFQDIAAMEPLKFEPFGEQFEQRSAQESPASKWLLWAGSAAFWSMVAFIVAARAAYFDPGVFSFERLAALFRTVL
jgi:hypothetical protein